MAVIRYHSFDFDGCLMNEAYLDELLVLENGQPNGDWTQTATAAQVDEALIKANQGFFTQILSSKGEKEDYVIVGSNRQDIHMDFGNAGKDNRGSAISRLEAVTKHLDAQIDKFLLADLEKNQTHGNEFDKIQNSLFLQANGIYLPNTKSSTLREQYTEVIDDASKVSLLFAQMQKAAVAHPDDTIEFHFYDDRKDIIEGLKKFFTEHPHLVPKNVVLNLSGYSGPQPKNSEANTRSPNSYPYGEAQSIASIKGHGVLPKSHQQWTDFYHDMRRMCTLTDDIYPEPTIMLHDEFKLPTILDYYTTHFQNRFEKIPEMSRRHMTTLLTKLSITERLRMDNPLVKDLLAKEVGHHKAIGRDHRYAVEVKGQSTLKQELQNLKGDFLKREILLELKQQIEQVADLSSLATLKADIVKSEKYQILAQGQGLTTRTLRLETDSVKALNKMFADKESRLINESQSSLKYK